jgi:hypothetical protein
MTSQQKHILLLNRRCRWRGIRVCGGRIKDEPIAAANPATPAPTMMTSKVHAAGKSQSMPVLSSKYDILVFAERIAQIRNTCLLGLVQT